MYKVKLGKVTLSTDARGLSQLREAFARMTHFGEMAQGARAYGATRRAAALHEAGHAVIHALDGDKVRRIRIIRARERSPDGKRQWIGLCLHNRGAISLTPETPLDALVALARSVAAGYLAEMAFDREDYRLNSSPDEQLIFSCLSPAIAEKMGADADGVHFAVAHGISNDLWAHRAAVLAIAGNLERYGQVSGHKLSRMLPPARGYIPMPLSGEIETCARVAAAMYAAPDSALVGAAKAIFSPAPEPQNRR